MESWNDARFMGFDLETHGDLREYALQPWRLQQRTARISSVSWVYKHAQGIEINGGLWPTRDQLIEMLQFALDQKRTICGWNVQFDIQWLLALGLDDLVFANRWLDGMLLWRHYFIEPEYDEDHRTRKSYGLKQAVAEYLPQFAGYAEDIDFEDLSPEALARLQQDNTRDTLFTLRLTKMFYSLLAPEPMRLRAALIEADCLPLVARANLHGMPADDLVAKHLAARLTREAETLLEQLEPHGVTEKVVRSPLKLAKVLFDQWRLPVLKENTSAKTGKVSRSTDKETLHELAFVDSRAKQLREYREALNNRTKFAEAVWTSAAYNGDGRTRPQALVFGTYSGRFTYASKQGRNKDERPIGFALHQMKRDKLFRESIVPPDGYTLVEVDAAGQEFRWMAIAANDDVMLQLCLPGEDAHAYMGAQIRHLDYREMLQRYHAGDPEADAQRRLGKVANLCVAADTLVLTDRGICPILQVTKRDRVWDGVEFVTHDGVVYSGVRPVLSYGGITATPDHKVLVRGEWVRLDEAARHGWAIEPALGAGEQSRGRAAVRIVDGLVRRAVREIRGALCSSTVRVWSGARCKPALSGDGAQHAVQGVRSAPEAPQGRSHDGRQCGGATGAEASQRLVPAVPEPEVSFVAELWRAWDRVSIFFCGRGGSLRSGAPAAPDLPAPGHRPGGQRRSLRARQPAIGDACREPGQPEPVYDIVNCGPRRRFAANGVIVHNSLQYRTSARKLLTVARVQYGIPMVMDESRLIHRTYQVSYKGVPAYWNKQIAMTKRLGYVETFAGRRVQVTGNWLGSRAWEMGSTAINYRIQGTGADQKYLALSVLRGYLVETGSYFAWDLHDGLYFFVPNKVLQRFVEVVPKVLARLPYRKAWGFDPPIPLPWDLKAGPSWGKLKEVKAQ